MRFKTTRSNEGQIVRLLSCLCILTMLALGSMARAQEAPRARAIVTLRDPAPLAAAPSDRRAAVAALTSGLAPTLARADAIVLRALSQVPALIVEIDADALLTLEADPRVLSVQWDERGGGTSDESRPAIGADAARTTYGLTGVGVRVAVLDSGVALSHPDLADSVIAQACFTGGGSPGSGSCPPGDTITGTSALDENGHGTNVTGVITSNGTIAPRGFAADAQIVAVRVLDNFNAGWLSDWIAGLDWIIDNQETLRVDVVNMSLGSFTLYPPNCDADQPAMARAIVILRDYWNVPVFVSTGNNGDPYLMAAPSCIADAIAVGASYDSDMGREPDTGTWRTRFGSSWPTCFDSPTGLARLACFSNGGSGVDLVAPGVYITSTGLSATTSRYAGTSQAAPTAAGVAALLLQARPSLSADAIESILRTTGVTLADHRGNGFIYPRIDALAAVQSVLTLLDSPVQTAPIARAVVGAVPEFTWTDVAGTDAYYLWLSHADGAKVYDLWLNPADLCAGGVCRFTSWFALAPGTHRWWIQAWDSVSGTSPWTGAALFVVVPPP